MKKSEKIIEMQRKLFEEIRQKSTSKFFLVDEISDELGISRFSAYRRINCDIVLNFEEIYTLCHKFQISLDKLMGLRDSNLFDCTYRTIDLTSPDAYLNYMLALLKNIESLKKSHDSNILMSATDIPVFHLVSHKELRFFKLYTWLHSVYNYKASLEEFLLRIETPEITGCYQKISSNYKMIPSSEIWTEDTINATLRLISYYIDISGFSNKDLPLLLCEQVLNILNKLQQWTESSMKGEGGASFQFFLSEMELENTYIIMKRSGSKKCIVKLFTINSLNVFDQEFCNETENWLLKLSQRAVLLCGNAEKERIKFFNAQRKKVHELMAKIHNAF
jgi:hypothetical protein